MAPITATLGKVSDLKPGTMKMVPVEGAQTQVLLVCGYDEKFYALGGKCTHYKGLLSSGVLSHTRVKCPLHGACFRLDNGQIEDFPGMDCITSYKLDVDKPSGNITLTAELEQLQKQQHEPEMATRRADSTAVCVIVGGGPAALQCAESLRSFGYDGQIKMFSAEPYLPIDRPKLSKKAGSELDEIYLRPKEYFTRHNIEIETGKKVIELDSSTQQITIDNQSEKVHYDKLVLCLGTDARRFQDITASNLHYMRTHVDSQQIYTAVKDKTVVIVGTSFIGMETAGSIVKLCKSVTCIDVNEVPFQLSFGKDIGARVKTWFESNNVKFISKASATEWKVENGLVVSVKLSTGQVVAGDEFIAGIGTTIPTKWLEKSSGLKLVERTGAIVVDELCQTNLPNVLAAGDCTSFPLDNYECNATIQHWQMAHHLGKIAASTLCKRAEPIGKITPFFWTVNFSKSMRYAGYSVGYDDLKVHGSIEEMKFVVYYFKKDTVVAAASLGMDPIVCRYSELMTSGDRKITRADVDEDPDLTKMANEVFSRLAKASPVK